MLKNSGRNSQRRETAPRRRRNLAPDLALGGEAPFSIGAKNESSLHRALKFRYAGSGGETETLAGSYVCDGRTCEGELIEVQTGSFGPLKEKIKKLTAAYKVRIIHPVFVEKTLELYDAGGALISRRKSPKKGSPWDLFNSLVYAPELPLLKNLTIELALVEAVEKRVDDGKGSWRRKGVRIGDRCLGAWRDAIILMKPGDYCRFIPFKKNEEFTARELREKAGIGARLAQKALYVFAKMNLVERTGKRGNALVYARTR